MTIQTRNGTPVEIYRTDAGGDYPVLGAIWNEHSKFWGSESWTSLGRYHCRDPHDSGLDLVIVERPNAPRDEVRDAIRGGRMKAAPALEAAE